MYQSYNEIFTQYESLRRTFDRVLHSQDEIKQFFNGFDYDEVIFIGCGSSYWAAMSAQMTWTGKTGTRARSIASGDILFNKSHYAKAFRMPIVIAPSRSGSTTETVEALRFLKEIYSCPVLAIVEFEDTAMEKLADLSLNLHWCREDSVCQTRSFSCLYLAMVQIAAIMANDQLLLNQMDRYIAAARSLFERNRPNLEAIANSDKRWTKVIALGNGVQLGVACEGALIINEMAQEPVSFYNTLELRHGPMVTVDPETLIVIFSGENGRNLEEDLAAECRSKGASVIAIVDEGAFNGADEVFAINTRSAPEITALFGVFILQGVAYYKALVKGVNPDAPAGLIPWIAIPEESLR